MDEDTPPKLLSAAEIVAMHRAEQWEAGQRKISPGVYIAVATLVFTATIAIASLMHYASQGEKKDGKSGSPPASVSPDHEP